jgi:hypothetical protein
MLFWLCSFAASTYNLIIDLIRESLLKLRLFLDEVSENCGDCISIFSMLGIALRFCDCRNRTVEKYKFTNIITTHFFISPEPFGA